MIDTNNLRQKLQSGDIVDHMDIHANVKPVLTELLDRLEAAERTAQDYLRIDREKALLAQRLEAVEKERDVLRAEVNHWKEQREPGAAGWRALAHKLQWLRDVDEDTRLYATPDASKITTWQPIDTAPKDGSQILLADHLVVSDGYFEPLSNNNKGSWIWPYVLRNPTHWKPLHDLPGAQAVPPMASDDTSLDKTQPAPSIPKLHVGNLPTLNLESSRKL